MGKNQKKSKKTHHTSHGQAAQVSQNQGRSGGPTPVEDWRRPLASVSSATSQPPERGAAQREHEAPPVEIAPIEPEKRRPPPPRSREQRLLLGIHAALGRLEKGEPSSLKKHGRAVALKDLKSRAESLPLMIQRHGPAQTLLFLESKDADDVALAWLLREALGHAKVPLAERLSERGIRSLNDEDGPDLTQRLHLTACCLELANLLMRTLKVLDRAQSNPTTATTGAEQ